MKSDSDIIDRRKSAFSLIETVLALGIMGLAITALLGLLPHGIEMSRKAANISATARILDTIQSRLSNNSFQALKNLPSTILHFDDQGVAVEDSGADQFSTYVVRVKPVGSGGAMLPGSKSLQTSLLSFSIEIAATASTNFDFDKAPKNSFDSVPVLIGPLVP